MPTRLLKIIVALLLATPAFLTGVPRAVAAHESCNLNATKVNNVHWGDISGQPSIKVVGQIRCEQEVDEVFATIILWHCDEEPNMNETWLQNHCEGWSNTRIWQPFPGDSTETVRAPSNAYAPITSSGWYIGDMEFYALDHDQVEQYGWYWSNAAFCTGIMTMTCVQS